jgi:ABC-type multidrug transport system fused ATPase/permease subunit
MLLDLLEKAGLSSLLQKEPKGLFMEITENGKNLSSGERQLICICRAVMRKSKFVILDEATSNIDIVTEEKVQ